jgi:hypothetical protein
MHDEEVFAHHPSLLERMHAIAEKNKNNAQNKIENILKRSTNSGFYRRTLETTEINWEALEG